MVGLWQQFAWSEIFALPFTSQMNLTSVAKWNNNILIRFSTRIKSWISKVLWIVLRTWNALEKCSLLLISPSIMNALQILIFLTVFISHLLCANTEHCRMKKSHFQSSINSECIRREHRFVNNYKTVGWFQEWRRERKEEKGLNLSGEWARHHLSWNFKKERRKFLQILSTLCYLKHIMKS